MHPTYRMPRPPLLRWRLPSTSIAPTCRKALLILISAIATAKQRRPELAAAIDQLSPRLHDQCDDLALRMQQLSGAAMAKGVEDTAYYRYSRFIALNEVGGDPGEFGIPLHDFHALQVARQDRLPASMTSLSTHDTKRGEDVRARLAVLSEIPEPWADFVELFLSMTAIPNRLFGYFVAQTLAGVGPIEPARLHAYAEKAMREASDGTTWTAPDAAFEKAVHDAVDAAYEEPRIRAAWDQMDGLVTAPGRSNSLGQKLVQLTMPGVPDVYQGTELWDDSLVDPDNRRPVDFARRIRLLEDARRRPAQHRRDGCGEVVDHSAGPSAAPCPAGLRSTVTGRSSRAVPRMIISSASIAAGR